MISVEMLPIPQQTSADLKSTCVTKLYGTNRSNSTQTYPSDLAKTEEGQLNLLEKSLEFLRSQHDSMLKALHDEVEQLRKTNKELQFRLVMCCCGSNAEARRNGATKSGCITVENEQMVEINELKTRLEEERRQNTLLQQQLASMNATLAGKSEKRLEKGKSESKTDDVADRDGIQRRKSSARRSSHSGGKNFTEITDMSKVERSTHTKTRLHGSGPRISSPELNAESSSSAIILEPDTVIDAPDGFWVRPSVAALNNPLAARPSVGARSNRGSGHILPVKLPVLHNPVDVKDNTKEVLTPTLSSRNDEVPEAPEGEAVGKKFSNQSNEARYSRSSKSVRNIIKMYEAARNSISRSNTTVPSNCNQSNHEPFLPAIVKSVDNNRTKKTRDSQKKQTYRNSDYRHP